MYEIVLYFVLNAAGFFFFLFLYNKFPKPRPYDYTTIPGFKLDMPAEQLPPLSISPGQSLETISGIKGHIGELTRFANFRQFLEYNSLCYGPLSSFYWGPRYVVSVSSPKMVNELAKYKDNLIAVSPLSTGSIFNGDPKTWSSVLWTSFENLEDTAEKKINFLIDEKKQNKILRNGPFPLAHDAEDCEPIDLIRSVRLAFEEELKTSKSIREILSRPLVVSYGIEIDVNAHPIPKYIPIVIHVGGLVQRWSTEEIWNEYWKTLNWVPGVKLLESLKPQIEQKIRREHRQRGK